MRRLTLLAAVAAVAGAHDAAAAIASAHDAVGEVSWAEAQCMLRKRRIAFLGVSVKGLACPDFNEFQGSGFPRQLSGNQKVRKKGEKEDRGDDARPSSSPRPPTPATWAP